MDCRHYHELISAGLDGESTPDEDAQLEEHLRTCHACRAHQQALVPLRRRVRIRAAEPVPDLSETIVASVAPLYRLAGLRGARLALLVVGLVLLGLSIPTVLMQASTGEEHHITRELAAFDAALAVGLVVAAWRPVRAPGLLPMVAAFTAVLGIIAVVDVAQGRAPTLAEPQHAGELVGLLLLWRVAHQVRDGQPPLAHHGGSRFHPGLAA